MEPHRSTRLLQLTGRWQYDGIMWLALRSVKSNNVVSAETHNKYLKYLPISFTHACTHQIMECYIHPFKPSQMELIFCPTCFSIIIYITCFNHLSLYLAKTFTELPYFSKSFLVQCVSFSMLDSPSRTGYDSEKSFCWMFLQTINIYSRPCRMF